MNKPYVRATPIGYNTGKVVIGGHYIPPPPPAGAHASFICGVLRGTERIGVMDTIISQISAKYRLLKTRLTKEQ